MGFQNPSIPVSATILLPISSPGKHPVRSLDSAHMTWRGSPITEGKPFLCLLELQRHILQYTFRSAMYGYTGIAIEDVGFRPLQRKVPHLERMKRDHCVWLFWCSLDIYLSEDCGLSGWGSLIKGPSTQ